MPVVTFMPYNQSIQMYTKHPRVISRTSRLSFINTPIFTHWYSTQMWYNSNALSSSVFYLVVFRQRRMCVPSPWHLSISLSVVDFIITTSSTQNAYVKPHISNFPFLSIRFHTILAYFYINVDYSNISVLCKNADWVFYSRFLYFSI